MDRKLPLNMDSPLKRKRVEVTGVKPTDSKPRTKRSLDQADTDAKPKSTKKKTAEESSSVWETPAEGGGDDLWAFPADNDNDFSNYNTEGGFAAAFEGVGFDDAVFEEDKSIAFQDNGSSLLSDFATADDNIVSDKTEATKGKEDQTLVNLTSYAGNGEKDEETFFQDRINGVWKYANKESADDRHGSYVNIATKSNLRVNRPKVSTGLSPRILIRHAETHRLVLNSALFNGMRLDKKPPRRLAVECLYYGDAKEKKPEFPTLYLLKFDTERAMRECFDALETLCSQLPKRPVPVDRVENDSGSADKAADTTSVKDVPKEIADDKVTRPTTDNDTSTTADATADVAAANENDGEPKSASVALKVTPAKPT